MLEIRLLTWNMLTCRKIKELHSIYLIEYLSSYESTEIDIFINFDHRRELFCGEHCLDAGGVQCSNIMHSDNASVASTGQHVVIARVVVP